LINLPLKMALVYIVLELLMPAFLFKKKIIPFFSSLLFIIIIVSFCKCIIATTLIVDNYLSGWRKDNLLDITVFALTMIKMSFALIVPVLVRVMGHLANIEKRQQILETDKLQAELSSLKSQIHPHFLFNTLNSLYSLIIKKSDKALDVILK